MINGLVSIVTPCYNKETVCGRFIQSVIDQTYRPIELIIVNDGSTDKSDDVILSYSEKLKTAGIAFYYIVQSNAGVGAALNTGLKEVHGEFLCWPDIDDWYAPEATALKVQYLQEHPEFAIVTSDADIYYENDMTQPKGLISKSFPRNLDAHQFYHLLCGQSIVCSGCHMVRIAALCDSLGRMEIFPSRFGQNLQMLLPVFYKQKRGFLDKALYHYVVYENSHSHFGLAFEKHIQQREGRYEIVVNTINSIPGMPENERRECIKINDIAEAKFRLNLAYDFGKTDLGKKQIDILRQYHACTIMHKLRYLCIEHKWLRIVYRVFLKIGLS